MKPRASVNRLRHLAPEGTRRDLILSGLIRAVWLDGTSPRTVRLARWIKSTSHLLGAWLVNFLGERGRRSILRAVLLLFDPNKPRSRSVVEHLGRRFAELGVTTTATPTGARDLAQLARTHALVVPADFLEAWSDSANDEKSLVDRVVSTAREQSGGRGSLVVNWIARAPIAQTGGGYRNIFRLAEHLSQRGHIVRMYIEPNDHLMGRSPSEICEWVKSNFGPLTVDLHVGHWNIRPADVTVATNWPTARVVAKHRRSLFKAYFIQDFEPSFYAPGDPQAPQADRTYWLPLRHICLGQNLANQISTHTGRRSDVVDFALDPEFTVSTPPESRGDVPRILFFARPGLKRRGYEVGVESLYEVKNRYPSAQIYFFGTETKELGEIGFAYENLGVLGPRELALAMNRAHVLLTFSLSNISNVAFEGMACGCAVVEADVPSVRDMVCPGVNCVLAEPEPAAVAEAIGRLIDNPQLRFQIASGGIKTGRSRSWRRSGEQLEAILQDMCFVRLPVSAGTR